MNTKKQSIQCTSCGAPLTLHGGGHKIQSLTCEYCGAVLDARKKYAVLSKYSEHKEPYYSPLKLGDQGKLQGVEFVVIGIVEWLAGLDRWIEYQLYSPTHGYVWLEYSLGHWTFTRRVRSLPDKHVWSLTTKETFVANQRSYVFFSKYSAEITYVAGELTWVARVGDKTTLAEGIDPPYGYLVEYQKKETEYYFSEYIEAPIVEEAFDVKGKMKPAKMHSLKPYSSKWLEPLSKVSLPFFFIAFAFILLIGFIAPGSSGEVTFLGNQSSLNGYVKTTYEFRVAYSNRLIEVTLNTGSAGDLYDMQIINQQTEEIILNLGNKESAIEKSHGFGYRVLANIGKVKTQIAIQDEGVYILSFYRKKIISNGTISTPFVPVDIKEGYFSSHYFLQILMISLLFIVIAAFSRWWFELKRWELS